MLAILVAGVDMAPLMFDVHYLEEHSAETVLKALETFQGMGLFLAE